jgi:ankyrin repeat protein
MNPALYKAATQGKMSSLKQLVDPEDPSVLSATTPQLNTALHLAALHGHAEFAGEVLDMNEELLVAQNNDGDTPLHLAAKAGKLEVARLLVNRALAWPQDKKSPLIMTNKAGDTALHEAVKYRRGAVAVVLLDADPNRGHDLNERMESPLDMAAREGLVQVVQKIVNSPWVGQEFLPGISLSGTALHQAVLGTHHRKRCMFLCIFSRTVVPPLRIDNCSMFTKIHITACTHGRTLQGSWRSCWTRGLI